ncbi:MAG: ribonuclease P protein component [Bacteroidetes bacterium GWF2_38_335]|nr:MAG: ribonuclease P protein component [Bacteroidetes bacterium GWF2_38_335]OFY77238.1 MAG: ribonuclease P protein component [Bacteroidetes bacterium RIFOXYA12_FULL_38_20]HBS85761.1 ribonuclease P protein component [Bacteroidales bacterium]
MNHRFTKAERLTGKYEIDNIFKKGKSFYVFPFRVMYYEPEQKSEIPARVIISVPKRKFKHASDRNLIKRRIREAYRLNKNDFYDKLVARNQNLHFMIIYTDQAIQEYNIIESKIIVTLQRLLLESST